MVVKSKWSYEDLLATKAGREEEENRGAESENEFDNSINDFWCYDKSKFQDHQRNRKVQNRKIIQPLKTQRFKWFNLISLYPLAETI